MLSGWSRIVRWLVIHLGASDILAVSTAALLVVFFRCFVVFYFKLRYTLTRHFRHNHSSEYMLISDAGFVLFIYNVHNASALIDISV